MCVSGGGELSQHLISSKTDLRPSSSDPILSWDRTKRLTGETVGSNRWHVLSF